MPSLIYGFGVTGKSFQRYLDIKGEEFEIYDTLHSDSLKIASKIEDGFYKNIYVSPSVPKEKFRNLKKYSTVITDMDLSLIHISDPRDGLLSRMPSSA